MDTEIDDNITQANSFTKRENTQISAKWGDAVGGGGLTGFVALPEVLIRGQHLLGPVDENGKPAGLTSTEMMVLINVLMHWWYADRRPFPGNHVIATRMGVSKRTVQRAITELDRKNIIQRNTRKYGSTDGLHSVRQIDLTKLVAKLQTIATELKAFNIEQAKEDKDRVFKHVV